MKTKKINTKKLTLSALFVALGLLIPFVTSHAFGVQGTVLLPMHFSVLLSGLLCGPIYGLLVGLVTPVLSAVLTGMPPMFPMLPIMTAELAVYGLAAGVFRIKLKWNTYISLILAMICGRISYGIVFQILLILNGKLMALTVWLAITTGIIGIIAQIVLLPPIEMLIRRMVKFETHPCNAFDMAKDMIRTGTATCVFIKDNKIIGKSTEKGIRPLLGRDLSGVFVVDKIIGKAAAMLLTDGGAAKVYSDTMSAPAIELFTKYGIKFEYGTKVDAITGCMMEKAVEGIDDLKSGIKALVGDRTLS
ncbi:MAG: DUF1893 domain-containing protein [Ruminococcus sp.]|jgi:hypothetical protein|nr:DUF1893 domain-containing protein [Ruminococcus sp.]